MKNPPKRDVAGHDDDSPLIQRQYSTTQLRELFDFCQHDFNRYIALLVWLESFEA